MAWFQKKKKPQFDTLHVIRFTPNNQFYDKYLLGNVKENTQEVFIKPFTSSDICRYVLMDDSKEKYFGWVRLSYRSEGTVKFCLEFHLNTDILNDEQVTAIIALITRSANVRYQIKGLCIIPTHPSGVSPRLKAAAKKVGYSDDWDGELMCEHPNLMALAEFQRAEINHWVTEYKIPRPETLKGGK